MKLNPGSAGKLLAHGFAAILLGGVSLVTVADTNRDEIVQTVGGLSYVSGGVGTESIDRLNALAGGFNLKLVFASKSGEYLSGVRVSIADATGRTLLDTVSEGPWFLTRLPVGDYRIVASLADNAVKQRISVGTDKLRTIDFRWASE